MILTEIYVLAGFLGSGKTTLLKQLLIEEKKQNRRVAVMMNELGKVSIDSDAIEEDVPLKELLDGCICCSIQDKLEAQLQGLLMIEKPEVIYIEATGAAHPVEVLDAVLSPLFADKIHVKGIISVVDGFRWLNRKTLSPQVQQLLIEQVRHADLILLNKTDELSEEEQAKLSMEIQGLNSRAFSVLTAFSKVPVEYIKKLSFSTKERTVLSHVKKDLKLSSYVYKFEKQVEQEEFEDFLRNLPDTMYRIKGYIKFSYSNFPFLFQFSYGMPIYLQENMNMPLNLVFIGENINWQEIERQLKVLEKKEPSF
ncbi:GTP-binding protein [Bacillus sp. DTU_2020_1000418_1_SI_GHA_SEK_038]|uniref:CobW family GTP-binding protein n=1 Tax=Bacillus sp. DTU_2020_1000418_1_SI_GHA_SEK_038 TaxID=3077585 RepID=UPI0028EB65CC|nr:GTP-binding protein [Bacillus sp. DTU_2020_1000418_1_SI_GHA_SEK_038]WNS73875.1 GTP-binding protein [Bacillus sp. DTU_2020_1000418_1_SI_GHA_SEK_038]